MFSVTFLNDYKFGLHTRTEAFGTRKKKHSLTDIYIHKSTDLSLNA